MSKFYHNYSKPSQKELLTNLNELEYHITQENGTERPFTHPYNDNKEKGIYVDILSGEPLFSSSDKFNSGSGWPSFTKPINCDYIIEKEDFSLSQKRIEIRSKYANNHLGHMFNDGPLPLGTRYCINGAALKFIPFNKMLEEGYSEYINRILE